MELRVWMPGKCPDGRLMMLRIATGEVSPSLGSADIEAATFARCRVAATNRSTVPMRNAPPAEDSGRGDVVLD